ncbi:MAG TPA: prepilin-type N-terminal cleavage/methylation domain-containing protein [Longimicrobium sp.]|nr:prepilin-type N-terminal cleavage/methylation domain-containing protein [Longimicrobium sp.]
METELLRRRRLGREGFTLIEAMISMVLLGIVLISFQAVAADRMIGDLQRNDRRTVALQLAVDRVRAVQLDPVYTALASRYAGTENPVSGFPGYSRTTALTRTQSGRVDYYTVTVTVNHAQLTRPVKRTLVIAAP